MTAFPVAPAMSFVEETYQVIALYGQNELRLVEPGNDGGVRAQDVSGTHHQGEGGLHRLGAGSGAGRRSRACCRRPERTRRFLAGSRSSSTSRRVTASLFLAAGADGAGAIYTEHVHAIHIIRMVILRVGAITDYLVLKLH